MKTFYLIALTAIFSLYFNFSYSQEACKVLKPEIAEKYDGKCKNGLAHGKGKAEGIDKYEGKFKNGLPDGHGKYTWSTGEIYEGAWKEGKKEGEGKYYYKKEGADSIRHGIWKDDVFFKRIIPNPYTVLRSTASRYTVRRVGDGSKILFTVSQGNAATSGSLNNINITSSSGSRIDVGSKPGLENFDIPVKCRFTFSVPNSYKTANIDVEFEIQFIEQGTWEVLINI